MQKKINLAVLILTLVLLLVSIILYIAQGLAAVATKIVFGLTAAGIIAYGILFRKELIKLFSKPGSVTGVIKIAQIVVIAGIMVFVYLLSDSISFKIDLTKTRLYSLSDESLSLIQSITNDMNITYFKSPASGNRPEFDYQLNLIKAYTEKNHFIKFRQIDPVANRVTAVDYNIQQDATVVFEYQGNKIYVGLDKILDQDQNTGQLVYKGEAAYTGALKNLLLSKPKNIYVLTGHGEGNPGDRGNNGYRGIMDRISQDNVKLKPLNLLQLPEIPADTSLIIINNPTKPILADELDQIGRFMDAGGNVLVFLELESDITVNDILSRMGVYYYPNLVIEGQDFNPQLGKTSVLPTFNSSEITDPLVKNRLKVVLQTAVGILTIPEKERKDKDPLKIVPLMTSSKFSYGETSLSEIKSGKVTEDGKDMKGPMTLAYAVTRQKNDITTTRDGTVTNTVESRLVVFGDNDFVNNTYVDRYGNSDLVLNAVNFLLKREANITIRPKSSQITSFQLTSSESRGLAVFAFSIFLIYLIPGIIVIVRRRRQVKS